MTTPDRLTAIIWHNVPWALYGFLIGYFLVQIKRFIRMQWRTYKLNRDIREFDKWRKW